MPRRQRPWDFRRSQSAHVRAQPTFRPRNAVEIPPRRPESRRDALSGGSKPRFHRLPGAMMILVSMTAAHELVRRPLRSRKARRSGGTVISITTEISALPPPERAHRLPPSIPSRAGPCPGQDVNCLIRRSPLPSPEARSGRVWHRPRHFVGLADPDDERGSSLLPNFPSAGQKGPRFSGE